MSRARALAPYGALAALAITLLVVRAVVATSPLDRLAPVASEHGDPPTSTARAGSLLIARGGPVIVGFESARPARLVVGTKEVYGRGTVTDRIVLPAGPIAVRFAGDGRLLWHPVGRRGAEALEYVPASSLSPDPPDRASFPSSSGASPLDGVIALALLAIVVAALCLLARRRLAALPRAQWLGIAAVFAVALVVRLVDLGGQGATWDEDVNWSAGKDYITNLLSLDFSADSWRWNYEHPPVMKYLAGIGAQFADGYGPARALSALCVALGCGLLVPIGARLYRLRVGILAGAIAALLPPLVAHGQIVGHEAPTVLWWSLAIVLALGVHDGEPDRRALRWRLVAVGAAIGVAVASRYVGGLVGPLCLAIVAIQAPPALRYRVAKDAMVIMPLVALATLYVLWPRLWLHPFAAMDESFAKLHQTHAPEPYLGGYTAHPPPSYFVVYLTATLPIGALIGVVAWGVRAARIRDHRALITLLWLVMPLGVTFSPVRQDGVRYVIPAVVALAMCAAVGWDYLATLVEKRFARAFHAAAAVVVAYLAIVVVRTHPYYLDYFGEQVGGAGTVAAHGWFETAWWGEGVDRAVAYVNDHAAPNAHVLNCTLPNHLTWFRQDLWTPGPPDWIVHYGDAQCSIPAGARRVYTVDADGAVLAEVFTTARASADSSSGDR